MGAAFAVALALAMAVLARKGAGQGGIILALRITARWSFLVFWPAYAGGALAVLFGPTFQALAGRGRTLGLAFASAHLVHVALVVWLYHIAVKPPVSEFSLVFFSVGIFFTYLLALLSVGRVSALLTPPAGCWVRTIGMEYIAFAFLVDFARNPFRGGAANLVAYLPFLALAVAGPALRLAGRVRRSRSSRLAVN
jgi:hypothetical protein